MSLFTFKDTVFEKYDTIIFDLDGTIWDCFTPNGIGIGANKTIPPYTLKDSQTIVDINGNLIKLQYGIIDFIRTADQEDKNLGIVSRSEVENLTEQAQPSIMLLKRFRIYKFFNYEITIKYNMPDKSEYVKANGKTLFIDNEKQNTDNVNRLDVVDVLLRNSFQNWEDLLNSNAKLHFNRG